MEGVGLGFLHSWTVSSRARQLGSRGIEIARAVGRG